jgi:hypothetical protein
MVCDLLKYYKVAAQITKQNEHWNFHQDLKLQQLQLKPVLHGLSQQYKNYIGYFTLQNLFQTL